MALDGRIEPGDMILQVNDVNFENMTNDEAVRVLREVVQKPGSVLVHILHGLAQKSRFFVFLGLLSWSLQNVGILIRRGTLRFQELNLLDRLIQVRNTYIFLNATFYFITFKLHTQSRILVKCVQFISENQSFVLRGGLSIQL